MFYGLGKEERTKIRKKQREKKKKKEKKGKKRNKPHRGQNGLVGMKGYLKIYNHMKYFLPYFKPFLNETAFYAKLVGRFSGSKTKVT